MDRLIVRGGRPLAGRVRIGGAKNATLPEMTAALLTADEVRLEGTPGVRDVVTMATLLEKNGAEVERGDGSIAIRVARVSGGEAPYELVKTMRASVLVLGPLLARTGHARVSLPGGCAIGARPINLHLAALERLGARVAIEHGYVEARADRLRGAEIHFDMKTVTGTENAMMAATLAEGETVLANCAEEPEVSDLAVLLVAMGARIEGAGTPVIRIRGVSSLHGTHHRVIPDRIEAGTFACMAAIAGGEVELEGARAEHLEAVIAKLREAGVEIEPRAGGIMVRSDRKLRPTDLRTAEHPGFPTDMQAQYMALMTQAQGISVITETIFENRFMHVAELRRLGARVRLEDGSAIVAGPSPLSGATVMATDLRASASLLVAALVADGETSVERVYHLDRGYESIEHKLRGLGAVVRREKGGGA